jgi:MFS family permease
MKRSHIRDIYKWVILGISFVTFAIAFGQRFTFSVFFVALLEEFAWNRAQLAGVFSLTMIISGAISPVVGTVVDRFNPKRMILVGACLYSLALCLSSQVNTLWQYYLTYGILMPFGFSFVATVSQSRILVNWFLQRRGTAMGIAFSGSGIGILCLVPLSQYLILRFTWRGAYLFLALIIFLFIFILSALFQKAFPEGGDVQEAVKDPRKETGEHVVSSRHVNRSWALETWTLAKAMRTRQFWLLCVTCILNGAGLYCILVHQIAYLVDVGFDKMLASSIFGLTGIFTTIGRGLFGAASDRLGREEIFIGAQILIIGSIFILFALNREPAVFLLYVYAVLLGLGYGATGPQLMAATIVDIFERTAFGAIWGFAVLGFGVGTAVGPWIGGLLFDLLGNYTLVFLISILNLSVGSITFWLAAPRKIRMVIGKVDQERRKVDPSESPPGQI